MLDILDLVLDLILGWNVLPCGQEYSFVHLPIFHEQYMDRNDTREVEHVYVVLHRHLETKLTVLMFYVCGPGLHFTCSFLYPQLFDNN